MRSVPDFRPFVWSSSIVAPSKYPPTRPSFDRNSSITPWFQSDIASLLVVVRLRRATFPDPRDFPYPRGHAPAGDAAHLADAREGRARDPARRLRLRAEVGRVPLDRLPRRRGDRDRQPQRAPDDAVLPRRRRGGPGGPAPTP